MNQRFEEDRAEIEAHFADRVNAYIELGETPEQAQLSALEKFGEKEIVIQQLRKQSILKSPTSWSVVCAVGIIVSALIGKHYFHFSASTNFMLTTLFYVVYFSRNTGSKRLRSSK